MIEYKGKRIKNVCAMCGEPAFYMGTNKWTCAFCNRISVFDREKKMPVLWADYKKGHNIKWQD